MAPMPKEWQTNPVLTLDNKRRERKPK